MNKVQTQTREPIKGDFIIKSLKETIKDHGYPFFFNYNHGLTTLVPTDDFNVAEYGNLNFYYGPSIPVSLSKGYITIERVMKPDNLIKDLKVCFLIRQERTKEILGWLCWE